MPGSAGDYVAWIGPAISQAAYEVGEDVAAQVRLQSRPVGLAPGRKVGKFQLDLPALAAEIMKDQGVSAVASCGVCAYSDARTYSYRRDGTTGRMATLAWLR
jgi:copper oxidase (laccase) domain-containing protein